MSVSALFDALAGAEAEAARRHEAGACHLSEWSCSLCEEWSP